MPESRNTVYTPCFKYQYKLLPLGDHQSSLVWLSPVICTFNLFSPGMGNSPTKTLDIYQVSPMNPSGRFIHKNHVDQADLLDSIGKNTILDQCIFHLSVKCIQRENESVFSRRTLG